MPRLWIVAPLRVIGRRNFRRRDGGLAVSQLITQKPQFYIVRLREFWMPFHTHLLEVLDAAAILGELVCQGVAKDRQTAMSFKEL